MSTGAAKYITSLRVIIVEGRCPSKESHSSRAYGKKIEEAAAKECKTPLETDVVVVIDFFYEGDKNRPDVDNAEKLILDSLKGIAFNDDKQVKLVGGSIHDTSEVMKFKGQPIFLIDPLMKGVHEYIVIRVHEK